MAASKKDIEHWRLERFKNSMSDFPGGRIEPTEEPDFLVHGNHHVVGIELTDLHRVTAPGQIPQQASEAMRKRIVAQAQEIYTSREHPPVLVSFFLNDRIHIKKPEVEPLATELADLVALNIPDPNSTVEVPADWDDMRQLPDILHSLSVHRLDSITNTFFNAPGATWVGTLAREDIERVLSSKEPKSNTYRTQCDEVWLVINVDIESMSTWFELEASVLNEPFTTQFDRVFLVQHFGGKTHELRVQKQEPDLK